MATWYRQLTLRFLKEETYRNAERLMEILNERSMNSLLNRLIDDRIQRYEDKHQRDQKQDEIIRRLSEIQEVIEPLTHY